MAVSQIKISSEGPSFSRLAQGFGSCARWGKDAAGVLEHIGACVELGVNTLDTAAAYGDGRAEELLGEALALRPALRERLQLVTKCAIGRFGSSLYHYDTSKAEIVSSAERSLRRLGTDRIDVLLIHRPDPLMDADEVAEAFTELRQSGKVLHFGVSNFTCSQFELLSSRLDFPLVTNEVECSVMHLEPCYDGTLDMCQRLRISPLGWGPLGGGRLFREETERADRLRKELETVGQEFGGASIDQVALAWVLKHPSKVIPILGTGKIDRVRSAVEAESVHLTREQWFRIFVASTGERLP